MTTFTVGFRSALSSLAAKVGLMLLVASALQCTATTVIGTGDGGPDLPSNSGGASTGGTGTGGTGGIGTGGSETGGIGTGGIGTGGMGTGGDTTGGVMGTGGRPFNTCTDTVSGGFAGSCAPASLVFTSLGGSGNPNPPTQLLPTCSTPTSIVTPSSVPELRTLMSRTWQICEGTHPLFCLPQSGLTISHDDKFNFVALTPEKQPLSTPSATGSITYCQGHVILKTDNGAAAMSSDVVLGADASNHLILILNSGPNETRYGSY